jgi:hypothetical protein
MKSGLAPEVCSGTYFPLRGRPERNYYVVLGEHVLAGPFDTRQAASKHLAVLCQQSVKRLAAPPVLSTRLDPQSARALAAVLRQQEKALAVAVGTAS